MLATKPFARQATISGAAPRLVAREPFEKGTIVVSTRTAICAIGLLATFAVAGEAVFAAPGEVVDVMLDDPNTIRWDFLAGTKGYNVYHKTGPPADDDYGSCLVGSHRTTTLTDLDNLPAGGLHIFYVTGFDETGEGSAGLNPTGAERTTRRSGTGAESVDGVVRHVERIDGPLPALGGVRPRGHRLVFHRAWPEAPDRWQLYNHQSRIGCGRIGVQDGGEPSIAR
jgi:hypothetical protein